MSGFPILSVMILLPIAAAVLLPALAAAGYPVLAGLSRKSSLGELTGRPVDERLAASLAAALAAVVRGASLLRVHAVRATRDALVVWLAADGADRAAIRSEPDPA